MIMFISAERKHIARENASAGLLRKGSVTASRTHDSEEERQAV